MKLKRILSAILLLSLLFTLIVGCARASAEGAPTAADAPTAAAETTRILRGQKSVETRVTAAPLRGLPTDGRMVNSRFDESDVPVSNHAGFQAYLTDAQVSVVESVYDAQELIDRFDGYKYTNYRQKAAYVLATARGQLYRDVVSANEAVQACGTDAQAKYEALKARATKTVTYALYGQKLEETDYEVEILYENDLLIGAVVLKVGTNGEKTLANTGSDALSTLCNGDNKALFEMAVGTLVAVPEFDVMGFAIVSYGTKVYLAPIGIYDNYGYMEYADPESSWFDFYTFAPERFATVEEGRAILAK